MPVRSKSQFEKSGHNLDGLKLVIAGWHMDLPSGGPGVRIGSETAVPARRRCDRSALISGPPRPKPLSKRQRVPLMLLAYHSQARRTP